ncbi:MAG: type II secretion system protein [Gammaproteobacteria bacterium]|nr:type II secretion system protein [Gammaproteobacteria bacterium]
MKLENLTSNVRQKGFTLMELIGVMAVMAILAGALSPNIADSINQAYSDAEIENMTLIADSLNKYIQQEKRIPSAKPSSWVKALSSSSTFINEDLEYNNKGYRRRFIFDPRFFSNADKKFSGFKQNKGLAEAPVSPRVLLVSDMTRHVPSVSNNAKVFNAIWNQTKNSKFVESKNLKIKRINLSDKFHRVILSNQDKSKPYYQLEKGKYAFIPAAKKGSDGIITRYIINSTRINLFDAPYPTGKLEQTAIIQSDWTTRYQANGKNWSWVKP